MIQVSINPEELKIVRDWQQFLIELNEFQVVEALERIADVDLPSPEKLMNEHQYDGESLYNLELAARVMVQKLLSFADDIKEYNK